MACQRSWHVSNTAQYGPLDFCHFYLVISLSFSFVIGSKECVKRKCDYYFNLDAVAHIDNPHTLRLLIEQNRPVVAPIMIRPYKAWSNFWGSLTSDGFYARSMDYMDIIHTKRR